MTPTSAAMPATSPSQIPQRPPLPVQQHQPITTETVQKYLDENEALIATIVEAMNTGRLKDCIQYQSRLQQNLMYLAAIADQHPAPQPQQKN